MNPSGRFVLTWCLAVSACAAALVLYLGFRVKALELGYELGALHQQNRYLQEVKRAVELEVASYETPERVELVARALLGLSEPTWDRVVILSPVPEGTRAEAPPAMSLEPEAKTGTLWAAPSVITGSSFNVTP